MRTTVEDVRHNLQALADPARVDVLQRFFKTGAGEYGEGDRFLGLRVPQVRILARAHRDLEPEPLLALLGSSWHEERLLALLILVDQYRRGSDAVRERIHRIYLTNTRYINNWDLVDLSAEHIVGAHLDPQDLTLLDELARSPSVWERRIAMMATFHWIKRGVLEPALHMRFLPTPGIRSRRTITCRRPRQTISSASPAIAQARDAGHHERNES